MFLIFAFSSSHGLSKHNDAAIRIVIWKFYFKTLPPFFSVFVSSISTQQINKYITDQ